MNKRSIYIFPFLLLFLSCSSTPKSTVEQMRERACNRDVNGFLGYVNKTEVEKNLKIQVMIREEPSNEGKKLGQPLDRPFVETLRQNLMAKIWQELEDELKKGKDSTFCKLQIVKNNKKINKEDEVKVKIGDGESTWRFTKSNNKWLVTDLFGSEGQNRLTE